MVVDIWVNIGSCDDTLFGAAGPFSEQILTYSECGYPLYIWMKF